MAKKNPEQIHELDASLTYGDVPIIYHLCAYEDAAQNIGKSQNISNVTNIPYVE